MSPTHNSLPSDITSDHAKQWAYWCQVAFTAASCSGRIWTVKHAAEAPRAVGTVVARSYRAKPTCCWSEPGWWCRGSEHGCLVSPCCRLLQMGSAWLHPPGLCAHNSPLTCTLGFVLSAFVLTTTSQHHQLSGSELLGRSLDLLSPASLAFPPCLQLSRKMWEGSEQGVCQLLKCSGEPSVI